MRWTLLALILSLFSVLCQADDLDASQIELERVNKALTALQAELKKNEKETNSQRAALETTEKQLSQTQRDLTRLAKNISDHRTQLAALDEQEVRLKALLAEKADDIKFILRLAYKQNNQPLIKLLLSGERPEDLSRNLYYFSVLTQNQQTQVEAWISEQAQLNETITEQKRVVAVLEEERVALDDRQQQLNAQKNKRAQIVANLQAQARSTQATIQEKQQEKEKLTQLIADITARLEAMNLDFPEAIDISGVKGGLNWPVEGKLMNRYGAVIDDTGLRWEGWLISANDGQPVKAVHGGRIVFADFFKSNGLLVIIDHGDGVWTLYGRNQALLRDVGSWVEAGDVIAEVGRSGGYSQSGLYFEVRKNGEPQNPASWLSR